MTSAETESYATIIVGAGPAGLAAANELIRLGVPGGGILILDMGPDLHVRMDARVSGQDNFNTYGLGGAGLFSDGKLCVPEDGTTLFPEIPTLLGTGDAVPNCHLQEAEAKALYRYAFSTFRELGVPIRTASAETRDIEHLRQVFSQWDVFFEYYHVYQIGADDLPVAINRMRATLIEAGVCLRTAANVVDISHDRPNCIELHCTEPGKEKGCYRCSSLVLAVGKVGRSWLDAQAQHVGLARAKRPVELGLRVEVPRELLDPFTRTHPDLKLFRRSGTRALTKTFCTCVGGMVVPCRYNESEDLIVLAGYTGAKPTCTTTFALMTKMDLGEVDPLEYAFSVVRMANHLGQGRPLLQRLGDLKRRTATTTEAMAGNSIVSTLREYRLVDINLAFPAFVIEATLQALAQFNQVVPGIDNDDTLISAPCMEFCYQRFAVDKHMQTIKEGIYVVGDVAGYAKGIIAASASGILAARHITTTNGHRLGTYR